ncbi:ABC transporter permease, partial [Pandoraea pneumonica]
IRRFGGLPAAVVLVLGFGLPLASLVVAAFEGNGAAFSAVALDPLVRDAFVNSLALAVGAGTVSLIVGALIAVTLARQ